MNEPPKVTYKGGSYSSMDPLTVRGSKESRLPGETANRVTGFRVFRPLIIQTSTP